MDNADSLDPKRRTGIQSVEIGAQVLFELANVGHPVALSDLSRRLDMAPPNVRRYLVSLVTTGLVEQDPNSLKYHLGVSSIRLGLTAMGQRPEIELALQVASELRDEVDCCVGLLCPGESGPVMLRWLENEDRVTHVGKVGASFSLIHSAAGRAFLAEMPEEAARLAFQREAKGAAIPTDQGRPLVISDFLAMLGETRARGHSHVRGDYTAGIEAVGACAFNAPRSIAFILTIVGRIGIFDSENKPEAPKALQRATHRLSSLLGFAEKAAPIAFPPRPALSLRDL